MDNLHLPLLEGRGTPGTPQLMTYIFGVANKRCQPNIQSLKQTSKASKQTSKASNKHPKPQTNIQSLKTKTIIQKVKLQSFIFLLQALVFSGVFKGGVDVMIKWSEPPISAAKQTNCANSNEVDLEAMEWTDPYDEQFPVATNFWLVICFFVCFV